MFILQGKPGGRDIAKGGIRSVWDACKTALPKLTHELRDIVVSIPERRKAQLDKEYAKALEEETLPRAEAKKAGTLYE